MPAVVDPRGRPEAVVRPGALGRGLAVSRAAPRHPALRPFVAYHWLVRWDLEEPHEQQVIPQPCVHLATEGGRLTATGVATGRFVRRLEGRGHVLGTAFRPGGFRPLVTGPATALVDVVRPAGELLDLDDRAVVAAVDAADDVEEMVGVVEAALAPVAPPPDPLAEEVAGWVALAERRVDVPPPDPLAPPAGGGALQDGAAAAGVGLRTLQRRFAEYVGVGPKWVIQRFRVLEVAAAANAGAVTDWTALAVQLGFADQSHLVNVFAEIVGTPPASYQREVGRVDET